ncbi:MAG: monovalent cation/H+ antiporter complex subunit F [Puniceicoccaceae bacterium]
MDLFLIFLSVWMALIIFIPLYRTLVGPTVFDRLLGVGGIGTKTVVFILLIGMVFDRLDMFIDISIAYAILNFIGSIMVAHYFARNKQRRNTE